MLFFCRGCSVRPFVGRITRPVPFVQQEAKASTHPRPRLMNCTAPDMDKDRQHGQPPNIEEIIRHAPNMDNMDNVDKRPDVWRRGGRPALFFCRGCSVRPFVGRITRPLFVQWEAKARKPQQYTTRRTRGRKYSRHPPKGGDLTHSYKKSVSRRGRY